MNAPRHRMVVATLMGALLGLPIGIAGPVWAQSDSAALADVILEKTLTFLGVETDPSEVLDELSDEVADAIDEGIIDDDVLETIDKADDLDTLLDGNLEDAEDVLESYAPLWRAAYEQIRIEFQACRTSSGKVSDCAKGLGFRFQIAQADALLADVDAQIAALEGLTPEGQEAELARLQALREEMVSRLERAQDKLENGPGKGVENASGIAAQARDRADTLRREKKKIDDASEMRDGVASTVTSSIPDSIAPQATDSGKGNDKESGKGSNRGNGKP